MRVSVWAFLALGAGRAALAATPPIAGAVAATPGAPGSAVTASSPAASARAVSTCAQDDPVPTPRGWRGWDRSAVVAWEAVEQAGGVVPEIEEDRAQSPPAWWRYPSALRSEALLENESRNPKLGLYRAVAPGEIGKGDILVRARGAAAGACGKMAVVGGRVGEQFITIEVDAEGQGPSTRPASPLFFADDGETLLPDVRAFRIRVKKDDTIGHLRELGRDLDHLERTIGDRPLLLARGRGAEGDEEAREVVSQKVHDLIDEAWSLVAEESYDLDRRELAGRALVLGAYLDWPAARAAAAAVLDDVLARSPARPQAAVARASLALLAGEPARALVLGQAALASGGAPARAEWVTSRALGELGRGPDADAALARFRAADPRDTRARQASERSAARAAGTPRASGGAEPAGDPGTRYFGTTSEAGVESRDLGFRVRWPLTWRVLGLASNAETGMLANFLTGRVLLPDGRADRAAAVLLAQRPASAAARALLVRDGARKMFPTAKLKALPPIVPGSRRDQFRERQDGVLHEGEVTTIDRGGVVTFLVLNAPAAVYTKLRDEYAGFVKSLAPLGAAPAAPAPGAAASPASNVRPPPAPSATGGAPASPGVPAPPR